jgi:hypothetical protein
VQIACLTLDCDLECGRPGGACVACELVTKGSHSGREIVTFDDRRSQALDCVAAFGDCLRRMFNRAIKFVFRLYGPFRQ